jgi:hypothetical protein
MNKGMIKICYIILCLIMNTIFLHRRIDSYDSEERCNDLGL